MWLDTIRRQNGVNENGVNDRNAAVGAVGLGVQGDFIRGPGLGLRHQA